MAATAPQVSRPRLVRRLLSATETPLALLVAPAGYGKTAVLAEWAARDQRAFAWVDLEPGKCEPRELVRAIAAALDSIEPLEEGGGNGLRALLKSLDRRTRSFVLVVDDAHELRTESLAVLAALVGRLKPGSQVALSLRREPAMRIGRLRAERKVVELRLGDLAMTPGEAAALLRRAGLGLTPDEIHTLARQGEGWPAGIYLRGLSLRERRASNRLSGPLQAFDRLVGDYVWDEMLCGLPRDHVVFLTRAAVLETLSGPACDAILERTGSARLLERLVRSGLLVFPDAREGRYRYHGLFRAALIARLRRVEPDLEAGLHRRAAAWCAVHDDVDAALRHAVASGDARLAGELMWANLCRYLEGARADRIKRWLDSFSDRDIAGHAPLALVAASAALARGDHDLAEHWRLAAVSVLEGAPRAGGDPSLGAGVTLLRAGLAADGIIRMGADAAYARDLLPAGSPWRATACLLEGVSRHLTGQREAARRMLREGAGRAATMSSRVHALCLAQLALVCRDERDWANAEALAARGRAAVQRSGLLGDPGSALVLAVSADARARAGRVDEARTDLQLVLRLMTRDAHHAPWYESELRVALARAALRLSDAALARRLLDEASRLHRQTSDAALLGQWIDDSRVGGDGPEEMLGRDSLLTAAELRVLLLLPTHLSIPAIAMQLNVSANTVKTHARAVYRKLEASSRSEAVARARDVGLVAPDAARLSPAA